MDVNTTIGVFVFAVVVAGILYTVLRKKGSKPSTGSGSGSGSTVNPPKQAQ